MRAWRYIEKVKKNEGHSSKKYEFQQPEGQGEEERQCELFGTWGK